MCTRCVGSIPFRFCPVNWHRRRKFNIVNDNPGVSSVDAHRIVSRRSTTGVVKGKTLPGRGRLFPSTLFFFSALISRGCFALATLPGHREGLLALHPYTPPCFPSTLCSRRRCAPRKRSSVPPPFARVEFLLKLILILPCNYNWYKIPPNLSLSTPLDFPRNSLRILI